MTRVFKLLSIVALGATASASLAQPANDHCADAQLITDGDWTYDLTGADTDGPTCSAVAAIGGQDSHDVWFEYVATASGTMNAVTCTNTFSSSVALYPPGCFGDELASGWIGAPDGPCPFSFAGDASIPVTAGQHVIIKVAVALFGSPAPSILHVEIRDPLTTCIVDPPGAVEETEPCGQNLNDNCANAMNIPFYPIDIAGTLVENLPTTDQDWFHVHADAPQLISASLTCDLPFMYMTLYAPQQGVCVTDGFDAPSVAETLIRDRCETGGFSALVSAGDYYIRLLPDSAVGYPCDTVNKYVLHVESTPVGACCLPGGCSLMTHSACDGAGGTYRGDATVCGEYAAATTSSPYEDISETANPGPGSTVDGPENNLVVDLGFDFTFYGNSYNQVSISTNGFLQFGDNPIAGSPFNRPLPSNVGSAPRNAICGLWDALVTESDEGYYNGSGRIVYQTRGAAPDRRFIAQWINVGQERLFPLSPEGDPVNFEIVLFESSNNIEFRYGAITPDPGNGTGGSDYTIGVQDVYGLTGTNIDPLSIGAGNTSLLLAYSSNCTTPCPADFNNDGGVDGADVEAFFTAWEGGQANSDVNQDGGIDGQDVEVFFLAWEAGGC